MRGEICKCFYEGKNNWKALKSYQVKTVFPLFFKWNFSYASDRALWNPVNKKQTNKIKTLKKKPTPTFKTVIKLGNELIIWFYGLHIKLKKRKRSVNPSDLPGITICYKESLLFFFRNKFTSQSSTMIECRAPNINGILRAELPPLGVNSRKILTAPVCFLCSAVCNISRRMNNKALASSCTVVRRICWMHLRVDVACESPCLVCRDANLQCPSFVSSAYSLQCLCHPVAFCICCFLR